MSTLPVWVKLPNLPLSCWSENCLSKIASVIGNPIQCDMLTSSMTRLSYARVLVEIDLRKKLCEYVKVCLPNGEVIEQQIIYETLLKFCSHCNVIGHLVETCTKFAKRNNASAANVVGGQVSVPKGVGEKDVLPTEDVSAEGKWETVKKKHRSNWRPKKTMAENVRGVAAKAASGVAARAASGMIDVVADTMPGSSVAANAANVVSNGAVSGVAAKVVNEVNGNEGLKADMPPVHNVPPKAVNGVTGKSASVMGMGEENVSIVGVSSGVMKGAAGVKSDRAMRGITDKVAGVDPLVAAWAVSSITVGADSSVANGADFVDSAVVNETEIVGTAVVASIESPLGATGRPKIHANRNSSKGKHIVEEVKGVTTRKGSKSKSSSSGHGRTLPTNPAL
ncbi:hypothetical protein OIU76_028429 [Salix suchowensis]|nr:hypothetical protein OIU76_028429 [Salix suchowensis]